MIGPDGRLNHRGEAFAAITDALKGLTGPDRAKVRNLLTDRRSLSFLDRMNRRLESAEPRPRWREERESYDRVAAVLGETVRAPSAVECRNSVLRMPQSRHRRMTQPMFDLKRLYGNSRPFRSGPRKDVCPYRALDLELPTFDFGTLLQADPEELAQRLSTTRNAE